MPVRALLTSASPDSGTAVDDDVERCDNLYDPMDAAYYSDKFRVPRQSMGHSPPIDHTPPCGKKKLFLPLRHKERAQAERTNGRLKNGLVVDPAQRIAFDIRGSGTIHHQLMRLLT